MKHMVALTLADFGVDGSIYSDLYKDWAGFRPRGLTWATAVDFYEDLEQMSALAAEAAEMEQILEDSTAHYEWLAQEAVASNSDVTENWYDDLMYGRIR
jgi:hypothetical protein